MFLASSSVTRARTLCSDSPAGFKSAPLFLAAKLSMCSQGAVLIVSRAATVVQMRPSFLYLSSHSPCNTCAKESRLSRPPDECASCCLNEDPSEYF